MEYLMRHCRHACLIMLALASTAALAQAPEAFEIFVDRTAPSFYLPGQPLTLRVNIHTKGAAQVTALRLLESIPEGWTFLAAQALSEHRRPTGPEEGASELLQFEWNPPPTLPYEFVYILQVPPDAQEMQELRGHLEYQVDGNLRETPQFVVQIAGPTQDGPTLTLEGENPLTLIVGTPYDEPGFKATDEKDGNLGAAVKVTGSVDTNTPGRYTLTYTLMDTDGNQAQPLHRLVLVSTGEVERTPRALMTSTASVPGTPATAGTAVPPPGDAAGGFEKESLSTMGLQVNTPELSPAAAAALEAGAASPQDLSVEAAGASRPKVNWIALAGVLLLAIIVLGVALVLWRVAYATPAWRKGNRGHRK